jgi:GTP-binding protein
MFIAPSGKVYTGQIVGENSRPGDMTCNPAKRKVQTNYRSSTKDQTVTLDVPRKMTLEEAMEWIAADELVEVTPKSIRLRKVLLGAEERKRARRLQMAPAK